MRSVQKTILSCGIFVAFGMGYLTACGLDPDDCKRNARCNPDGTPFDPSGGEGGGPPPPPPGCDVSPSDPTGDVLRDECGYFVSKTLKGGSATGTKTSPFETIQAALSATQKQARIYVCADGDYPEQLDLPAGVSIFGGLDCGSADWKYNGAVKTKINPAAPTDPAGLQASVRISGNGTSQLEDVEIIAANASLPGGSSISVIVDSATVNAARCQLTAGDGATGTNGPAPQGNVPAGATGLPGTDACSLPGGVSGGMGGMLMCDDGATGGGSGGKGGIVSADKPADGVDGTPSGNVNAGVYMGVDCNPGTKGADGAPGAYGPGAMGNGTLAATGFVGVDGQDGKPGGRAQGGGGGAGSKAGVFCKAGANTFEGPGASGGGGGAGGCGGKGGNAGKAGGSSIALISLNAKVSLTNVGLLKGNGADGGKGGDAQAGGSGGPIGLGGMSSNLAGSKNGCDGGKGGTGGDGGPGGGGSGGHSIGIAYSGTAPTGGDIMMVGTAGNGGAAGTAGPPEGIGAPGQSIATLMF